MSSTISSSKLQEGLVYQDLISKVLDVRTVEAARGQEPIEVRSH